LCRNTKVISIVAIETKRGLSAIDQRGQAGGIEGASHNCVLFHAYFTLNATKRELNKRLENRKKSVRKKLLSLMSNAVTPLERQQLHPWLRRDVFVAISGGWWDS
jgi:hypothetical protein